MAGIAKDVDTLKVYIRGVVGRAECHAPGVKGVVFAVLGAVIWCDEGDIIIGEYDGEMVNAVKFHAGGQLYYAGYNHDGEGTVEIRERNQNGDVLVSFDNDTKAGEIYNFFSCLRVPR